MAGSISRRRFEPSSSGRHLNRVGPTERGDRKPIGQVPDGAAVSEEHRLVERAAAGDIAAFEALYRCHVGRVHALCLRLCGDPLEAEEAAQEAFVRAWSRLGDFAGASRFATWLHRLTVNCVLARWRAAGRYRQRVVPIDDEALDEVPGAMATPPGVALDLDRAIRSLPKGARTAFVLHDVEGWRHREIAEHTGWAVGTSKTQLHRARRLLRRFLNDDG